jgi:hypothetical protein
MHYDRKFSIFQELPDTENIQTNTFVRNESIL